MDTPNPDRVGSTRTFTIPETYVGVLSDALNDAQDYRETNGDCADCDSADGGMCEDHTKDANRRLAYIRLEELLMDVPDHTPTPTATVPAAPAVARFDPSQYSWVPFDESLLSDKDKKEDCPTHGDDCLFRECLTCGRSDVVTAPGTEPYCSRHQPADPKEPESEPETITVDLTIENTYELYPDQTTYRKGLVIPVPPAQEDDAYGDWKYDHIHSQTGVGHEDGDSWYDVTVTASSRPDVLPVGTTFDFGY